MKVIVIDYQLGNISSIINMLKKIGVEAVHSHSPVDIQSADKLILPGVGAYDHGMGNLQNSGLISVLNEEVLIKKKPILGICLGMQLLLNGSAEGNLKGLGWIKGNCIRFYKENLRVPHMGWNSVKFLEKKQNSFTEIGREPRYYFVHSFHAICDEAYVLGTASYGYEFPAIIAHDNILGAQFHPEKSHRYGMKFLQSFIENNYAKN